MQHGTAREDAGEPFTARLASHKVPAPGRQCALSVGMNKTYCLLLRVRCTEAKASSRSTGVRRAAAGSIARREKTIGDRDELSNVKIRWITGARETAGMVDELVRRRRL